MVLLVTMCAKIGINLSPGFKSKFINGKSNEFIDITIRYIDVCVLKIICIYFLFQDQKIYVKIIKVYLQIASKREDKFVPLWLSI